MAEDVQLSQPAQLPEGPGPRPVSEKTLAEGAGEPSKDDSLRALIKARAFNFSLPPPKPYPILSLGGKVISTPGNLTGVQAGVKAGKTAVNGAIMAALMTDGQRGADTLGFTSQNRAGKAFIHIDTEQSGYDADAIVRTAIRRARVASPPAWLHSFCLTDFSTQDRLKALKLLLHDLSEMHGGIFMVIIDGLADLCADPNDATESFALVGDLHALAITHDCAIIAVLHENPGSTEGKMRGHLGSQLERKAETPLRLAKDAASGVTTIWSDRARHCHLPREQGACFAWSDEAGMHVSVGTAREIKASAKQAKYFQEAKAAFGSSATLGYSELIARIMEVADVTTKTAEKRVGTYQIEGVAVKNRDGKYTLKVPLPANPPTTLNPPSGG